MHMIVRTRRALEQQMLQQTGKQTTWRLKQALGPPLGAEAEGQTKKEETTHLS